MNPSHQVPRLIHGRYACTQTFMTPKKAVRERYIGCTPAIRQPFLLVGAELLVDPDIEHQHNAGPNV